MSKLSIIDADNHYYEARDVFARHFEPKLKDKMIRIESLPDGSDVISANGRRFNFLDDIQFNFNTAPKPGSLREFLMSLKADKVTESTIWEPIRKETVDRDARIAFMDAHGIETCFLFPTLGVCLEPLFRDDSEGLQANYRAFNRWLDDDWGFARDGRILAPPLISLTDLDAAIRELEWALSRGTRMIAMLPGPAAGRSPADPIFDPFWQRANEAKLTLVYHIGESGYNQMFSTYWGEEPWPSAHHQSAFQWTLFYGDRPIMDTMAILIYHNFFGRYPNIKVLSVENGCQWVPYLLNAMDKMKGMGRNGPWPGGRISGKPSEIFKQHVFVNPYHEEDHAALAKLIGTSQVVFGSDYPHAEGMERPEEMVAHLSAELPEADVRMIMHDNARRLMAA